MDNDFFLIDNYFGNLKLFGYKLMKKCPYCYEEIEEEAIVCRFCGEELPAAEGAEDRAIVPDGERFASPQPERTFEDDNRAFTGLIISSLCLTPPIILLLANWLKIGGSYGLYLILLFPIDLFFAIRSLKLSKGNAWAMAISIASILMNALGIIVFLLLIFAFSVVFSM